MVHAYPRYCAFDTPGLCMGGGGGRNSSGGLDADPYHDYSTADLTHPPTAIPTLAPSYAPTRTSTSTSGGFTPFGGGSDSGSRQQQQHRAHARAYCKFWGENDHDELVEQIASRVLAELDSRFLSLEYCGSVFDLGMCNSME